MNVLTAIHTERACETQITNSGVVGEEQGERIFQK